ncbi:MAG: NAD(P)H-dependent oxidoreductase subunit E [Deltaproteobacteria bacterium]|nr:NAD(P)H-dependent oxidoreductase subunit E [Deltaproteobacteria bacterium]MBN2671847.1 NAD(P)H-dependent oxidoreductase subunit E [Deltaproteobacteria bacterium]
MISTFAYLEEIHPEKGNIIKGLQLIQQKEGYLSQEALDTCSDYFSVPPAEVEGVVTFYSQFKRVKPGKYRVSVCDGTACHIKGTPLILDWISTALGIDDGETDADGLFSLETVACLGCCSLAPVLSVNGEIFGNLNRKSTLKILKKFRRQG